MLFSLVGAATQRTRNATGGAGATDETGREARPFHELSIVNSIAAPMFHYALGSARALLAERCG
jgi:hypothetical protein